MKEGYLLTTSKINVVCPYCKHINLVWYTQKTRKCIKCKEQFKMPKEARA